MSKIVIIGGGFGGLSAAAVLCSLKLDLDINVIDPKQGSDFLPLLPDIIGRPISPQFLTYRIEDISKKKGFKFINEEVIAISLEKKEVSTSSRTLDYDYLIIASGSQTNFYNNDNIRDNAYKLDDTGDVKKITEALRQNVFDNFIIAGAGYTGIEVATNLRVFLDKSKKDKKVIVVERAPSILGPLPEWMKTYVSENLKRLKVDVFVNTTIDRIEGPRVYLSAGRVFDNAFVIWVAGVKTANFIQNLKAEKPPKAG